MINPINQITRFPQVTGSNLNRKSFRLPTDFEGQLNLVLIAFRQYQQRDIDTWLPLAAQLAATHDSFYYYELPVIRSMNFLSRSFIDGGMRAGIPDANARHATITLYLDKQKFRDALGLPTEDTVYALLVDNHGEILWRAAGPCTPDYTTKLLDTIAAHTQTAVSI